MKLLLYSSVIPTAKQRLLIVESTMSSVAVLCPFYRPPRGDRVGCSREVRVTRVFHVAAAAAGRQVHCCNILPENVWTLLCLQCPTVSHQAASRCSYIIILLISQRSTAKAI